MTVFEQYLKYNQSVTQHPIHFYARMAHLGTSISKQNLQLFEELFDLGDKELVALINSKGIYEFIGKQGEILTDFREMTQKNIEQSAELITESQTTFEQLLDDVKVVKAPKNRRATGQRQAA